MNESVPASSLAQRREQFQLALGQRRLHIVEQWIELRMVRWSRIDVDALREDVVEFAESADDLNYSDLADHARDLWRRLEAVLTERPPPKDLQGTITASVERLSLHVDRMLSAGLTGAAKPGSARLTPDILIVGIDQETSAMLQWLSGRHGFECRKVADLVELKAAIACARPALVIIDESVLARAGIGLDPAVSKARFDGIPWIVLTWLPDIDLRLRALNAGASACLGKPLQIQETTSAVLLACLSFATHPLKVQIVADTPELAEHYATRLHAAGLTPLLGAQLANLPDVLAAHEADVLLLDINHDPRQRNLWLNLLADTPGFDVLPVVCLNRQAGETESRHRRAIFLNTPISQPVLINSLHRAVLENDLDTARVLRLIESRSHPKRCTLDVFITHLAAAITADAVTDSIPALIAVDIDSPTTVLRESGNETLIAMQRQIEARAFDLMQTTDCCTRLGNSGILILAHARSPEHLSEMMEYVRNWSRAEDTLASPACSAIAMALAGSALMARDVLAHCASALVNLRAAGGDRQRMLTVKPVTETVETIDHDSAGALPERHMRLHVRPLEDAGGTPQMLRDAQIEWQDDNGTLKPSTELFARVIANGLATQLDVWEMHAAASELLALPESIRGVEIAMRLSTASRESVMLVPVVRSVVAKLPPDRGFRLVFEVAESWLVNQNAAAVEMVEALRGLGCGVMLGDFGGTDNPRNLAWASWFDYARLSQRCIDQLTDTDESRQRVEKLLRAASSRGARIIARAKNRKLRGTLSEWGVALFEPH